jgi:hypothetical protein
MEEQEVDIWECDNCGHIDYLEKEVLCWHCSGVGEMIYKGKRWVPAVCEKYCRDSRSFVRKLFEFPFRLVGLIRYDPLKEENE